MLAFYGENHEVDLFDIIYILCDMKVVELVVSMWAGYADPVFLQLFGAVFSDKVLNILSGLLQPAPKVGAECPCPYNDNIQSAHLSFD
jgi:hypothetical protein